MEQTEQIADGTFNYTDIKMRTYEIKYEPIKIEGKVIDKYNIYYYVGKHLENKEFHSVDGINGDVRQGYTLKEK